MELCLDGAWSAVYHRHREVLEQDIHYTTADEVEAAPHKLAATVPGNFELDLVRGGLLPDPYVGDNILKVQEYEDTHWWYATTFTFAAYQDGAVLCFDGIDTVADIYLNGQLIASTDNMLVSHELDVSGVVQYENSLVVHLKPVCILARSHPVNAGSFAHKYWYDGLRVRKAVHMYGWDIMPRAVSAGIWRSVHIRSLKRAEITEFFIYPQKTGDLQRFAMLTFLFNLRIDERDDIREYAIEVAGRCKDSAFYERQQLWSTGGKYKIAVEHPYLWYPAGRGDQDLYEVTVRLYRRDTLADTYTTRLGIRSVELQKSSVTDAKGSGEFCFILNGERLFVTGTNWVPLDAFHSQDVKRLDRALELLPALHCNMVRCWGGNVYEDEAFFAYCDEQGILVWQDFSMACAIYPQDDAFAQVIRREAEQVVKKLRQHPSLALWAGDNECDLVFADWTGMKRNPNENRLTRQVLPQVLADHDPTRPYLPSSPYMDEYAFAHGGSANLPENHMWGARSYYKSGFYKNALAHFASEQGYMGCPSPETLKRFLSPENLWPYQNGEWALHGAAPEKAADEPYGNTSPFYFRTGVMADEIRELFGTIPEDLVRFAAASQVVHAEAMKFFVELYRMGKWRRTGIMWWNLLDGWPQISEAVVDYDFRRKQAFFALQMSQQPVCLMFGEPGDWGLDLYGVNDTKTPQTLRYTVSDLFKEGERVLEGDAILSPDASEPIGFLRFSVADQALLVIRWEGDDGRQGINYYLAGAPRFDLDRTLAAMIASGLFQAEGFDENLLTYFQEA